MQPRSSVNVGPELATFDCIPLTGDIEFAHIPLRGLSGVDVDDDLRSKFDFSSGHDGVQRLNSHGDNKVGGMNENLPTFCTVYNEFVFKNLANRRMLLLPSIMPSGLMAGDCFADTLPILKLLLESLAALRNIFGVGFVIISSGSRPSRDK